MKVSRAGLWLLLLIAPLAGAEGVSDDTVVPAAYRSAADAHAVPPVMLYALSLTESAVALSYGQRPWPWTLNIAGQGERYRTREAACSVLTQALASTRIVDVGLAQINVRWQPQLFGDGQRFADPCDALDPYANLNAAAAILRRCYQSNDNGWIQAAGCYHRPAGGAPAARYRRAFSAQLTRLDQESRLAANTSAAHATDKGTTHIASANPAQSDSTPSPSTPSEDRAAPPTRVTWINPETDDRHALD